MTDYIEPLDTVNDIVLNGTRIKDALSGQGLVKCSFDADITMSTQIEFAFLDPDFKLSRQAKFEIGSPASFQGYKFQVSRIEVSEANGNPQITVALRSAMVRKLKQQQGKLVLSNSSPTQFIQMELKKLGYRGVLQATPRRNVVARDVKGKAEAKRVDPTVADNEMSDWSTFHRFASETGYLVFENAGVLYFGQPKWLMNRDANPLTVAFGETALNNATGKKTRVFNVPEASISIDSKIAEVTATVDPKLYKQMQPGQAMKLAGVPGFNGSYLISRVSYDMLETSSISITGQTPINAKGSLK